MFGKQKAFKKSSTLCGYKYSIKDFKQRTNSPFRMFTESFLLFVLYEMLSKVCFHLYEALFKKMSDLRRKLCHTKLSNNVFIQFYFFT